ncbi:MAG: hypothetical protein A3D44_03590 [Candidatus Staskawiczbacteria bacterium RIFCSPHIGHO2_02_FULL_42_22]|uniref:Homing endonuclease LAGLIDADG domain-containing protein n=1 Tax=Candidatus Staskawiczbacteria bacterium RIFCSPHIGHO2_02_FULL_42_22 TaxID=1802207 RepID=A0A1G2I600_9BACT|nr:MAG: hypothetical protein A3D44_03590 [Candidatus Staskawiczbacteria bacterium RIFCSPHIGHO2_02_FULL_42_22]
MKPLGKVKIIWTPQFAYAIGLLTTDGSLSIDGRHISFTSKDKQQVDNYKLCFGLENKIGKKARGGETEKKYYVLQFGDVNFYRFLLGIGLTPNKSKTLGSLKVPERYFFDFLRGHLDGDGYFYSYWDPRWKSSFMFYIGFISASKNHIEWLRDNIAKKLGIKGHITASISSSVYQLKYAKTETLKLLPKLYYSENVVCLDRKRKKIEKALLIVR